MRNGLMDLLQQRQPQMTGFNPAAGVPPQPGQLAPASAPQQRQAGGGLRDLVSGIFGPAEYDGTGERLEMLKSIIGPVREMSMQTDSPILQLLAPIAQAGILRGGMAKTKEAQQRIKEKGQSEQEKSRQSLIDAMLPGGGTTGRRTPATSSSGGSLAGGEQISLSGDKAERARALRAGMIERGMPAHVADAFIVNMMDESALNPGINEANPIVPGSRGRFGLYQLTGPRRRAFEAFAAERGVSPSNVDAQLDWLMKELETTEKSAAQKIFSASNMNDAAVAIVNDFLRPAEQHRISRTQKYRNLNPASLPWAGGGNAPRQNPASQARARGLLEVMMNPEVPAQARRAAERQFRALNEPQATPSIPRDPISTGRGGLPAPRSKVEYDALPSGERFIDPEGNIRIKS